MRGLTVDRKNSVPIALQLEQMIKRVDRRGEIGPGERLPTEMELCATLRSAVHRFARLSVNSWLVDSWCGSRVVAHSSRRRLDRRKNAGSRRPNDHRPGRALVLAAPASVIWNEEHPERPVLLRFRIIGPVQLRAHLALTVAQGDAADIGLPIRLGRGSPPWNAAMCAR